MLYPAPAEILVVLRPPTNAHHSFARLRIVGLHAYRANHRVLARTGGDVHETIWRQQTATNKHGQCGKYEDQL